MSKELADELREELSLIAVMGHSEDAAVNRNIARMAVERARAALAAYDAKREAALKELADLGQAWDAAPGISPAVRKAMIAYHERAALILSGPGADRDAKEQIEKHRKWADELCAPAASPAPWTPPPEADREDEGS